LAIIAEFDNYVYGSLENESFKELTEKAFTSRTLIVEHTTSKKCKSTEMSRVKDPSTGNHRPLKIEF